MSTSAPPVQRTLHLRVPWTTVVIAAGVAGFVVLWERLLPASAGSTLTIRLMQLALAAGAAYLLDDASAALTTVAPRRLWHQRALALTTGLLAIAASWSVVLFTLRDVPDTALGLLTLEVSAWVLVALTASAVLAGRGETEPGNRVAVVLPMIGLAAVVAGGLLGFDIFPSGHAR